MKTADLLAAQGKKDEALALLRKYDRSSMTSDWKKKFESTIDALGKGKL